MQAVIPPQHSRWRPQGSNSRPCAASSLHLPPILCHSSLLCSTSHRTQVPPHWCTTRLVALAAEVTASPSRPTPALSPPEPPSALARLAELRLPFWAVPAPLSLPPLEPLPLLPPLHPLPLPLVAPWLNVAKLRVGSSCQRASLAATLLHSARCSPAGTKRVWLERVWLVLCARAVLAAQVLGCACCAAYCACGAHAKFTQQGRSRVVGFTWSVHSCLRCTCHGNCRAARVG